MSGSQSPIAPIIVLHVDARDLVCPLPLLKAKQALAKVDVGQCIEVSATDPASVRDFQSFVELTSHRLIKFANLSSSYTYVIQKG